MAKDFVRRMSVSGHLAPSSPFSSAIRDKRLNSGDNDRVKRYRTFALRSRAEDKLPTEPMSSAMRCVGNHQTKESEREL
jgi:hypothetical protein